MPSKLRDFINAMWTPIVFVRLTVWLIIGISMYLIFEPKFDFWIEIFGFMLLIYALCLKKSQKSAQKDYFSGMLGMMAFWIVLLFGMTLTDLRTPARNPMHLINCSDSITHLKVILTSDLTAKPKSYKAEAKIIQYFADNQWVETDSKILIYFQKSAKFADFRYGTKVIIKGTPRLIEAPTNPEAFDYQRHLKYQGIYHQMYVPDYSAQKMGTAPPYFLMDFALQIRRKCAEIFSNYLENPRTAGIIKALILGIKTGIDNELREQYASAGVMHILAVSGLHVGIIFKIIEWFLGFLNRTRRGKLIFALLMTLILFFYALITGFSPSVVRAVVMFSCVTWANATQRVSSTYNTIAFSAFVMLCYDPYFLTQVGFQLSYLAVIGIVYFYPKWHYRWTPPNRVSRLIWELMLVSMCAQITVTPLSLLYFNQFPVYFLLANVLIVPFISLFIGLGLGILGVAVFEAWSAVLPKLLGQVLDILLNGMNHSLFIINKLPHHLIQNISITFFEMCLLYGIIISVTCVFVLRRFWIIYLVIGWVAVFVSFNLYHYKVSSEQKLLSIYNLKSSHVGLIDGHQGIFIADSLTIHDKKQFESQILGHWRNKGIKEIKCLTFEDVMCNEFAFYVKFNKKILLLNVNAPSIDLSKLPDADIFIVPVRFSYFFKKLNEKQFKHIIVTGVRPYHSVDALELVLTSKAEKITLIAQNQYFEQRY